MNEFLSLIYLFSIVFALPLSIICTCYICIILSIASLPPIIDLIIYIPQGKFNPLIYRIEWVSASANALISAISQSFVSPQLRKLLMKD
ncbi:unnamed protein product [Adineta steineri]|uniref:Uncharacterized protein n=1 Tax=Adineta steineri TaxID=433720 RepID=A0A818ZTI0_9BILA|nr:unnamed protein product [Adineta steineri]CAF3774511.1 unnamed protein product [Adineta steineri]